MTMSRAGWIAGAVASAGFVPLRAAAQGSPLRIAITANDASAEPLYAQELGLFGKEKLDASIVQLANGGAIVSGLVSGAIDVGISNVISAVTAFKNGIPLRIVAVSSIYDGSAPQLALLVPKQSPISTAKDLEGKTIATNPIRGSGDLALTAWMQLRGADPATVKWIEMPLASMGGALAQGRIDAATVTEPFIALNRSATRLIAEPYSAIAPRFATIAFVAMEEWARSHADVVGRFRAVMRETAIWANANQSKSGAILAKYAKIDPQLVAVMSRVKYGEGVSAADIQPNIDVAAKYKRIAAGFSAEDMIYR
jgi:NitT/TauT family transport system substrate-binding protein